MKNGLEDILSSPNFVNNSSPGFHSLVGFPQEKDDNTTSTTNKMFHLVQELVENQRNCTKMDKKDLEYMPPLPPYDSNRNFSIHMGSTHLLVNKMTNMFEDLLIRSTNLDGSLRELKTIANITRKDVQDGFRALFSSQRAQHSSQFLTSTSNNNGGGGGYNNNNHNNNQQYHHRSSYERSGNNPRRHQNSNHNDNRQTQYSPSSVMGSTSSSEMMCKSFFLSCSFISHCLGPKVL